MLWSFSYPEVAKIFSTAASSLGVPFTPYMLRHSGPSWDRLQNLRTLAEVQKRGMWQSMRSIIRYEQAARSLSEYQKLPAQIRVHCEAVSGNLRRHEISGLPVPAPP